MLRDHLNYVLGQYVAMGVHASKKNPYPKKPIIANSKSDEKGFTVDSALDAYIVAMANKGENNGNNR